MTYNGHIKNGAIVLDEPVQLPEGASVRIELALEIQAEESLSKMLLRHAGCVEGLPPDLAENHDHYIHGTPRA